MTPEQKLELQNKIFFYGRLCLHLGELETILLDENLTEEKRETTKDQKRTTLNKILEIENQIQKMLQ